MFKGTRNDKGRTPGQANKITQHIREAFTDLLDNNLEKMQSDLDSLKPAERLRVLLELSSFVIPKLKATEITAPGIEREPIIINMAEWK
jgi:hypothetical protein